MERAKDLVPVAVVLKVCAGAVCLTPKYIWKSSNKKRRETTQI